MAYTAPTAANLKARYPALANVADETVDVWLVDARRYVDTTWFEADYAPAIMAAAAHSLASNGLGEGVTGQLPAGLSSFKSADFALSIDGSAARQSVASGWMSTSYGREYRTMLRRNKAGPRV